MSETDDDETDHDEADHDKADHDKADDIDSEFANMDEEEFESFLTETICEFAEENSAPSPRIVDFYGSGLLTKNHGLVVCISEAEFQVSVIRSR